MCSACRSFFWSMMPVLSLSSCAFCNEMRKVNGEAYMPHTISQALAELLRYMHEKKNALSIRDIRAFAPLHQLLDQPLKELHAHKSGSCQKTSGSNWLCRTALRKSGA